MVVTMQPKANIILHFYAIYNRIPPNVLFRKPILNRQNAQTKTN